MSWAGNINSVQIVFFDQTIEMRVDKIKAGRCTEVSEQARLDVLDLQRLAKQRIRVQINLSNGKIVGRAPLGVSLAQVFG